MSDKIYDKGAQSRTMHAAYDVDLIYPDEILTSLPRDKIIIDIGTGVGRDCSAFHEKTEGQSLVIGIDPDESNYREAVQTYPEKSFILCRNWDDVSHVNKNTGIAYLVSEVQTIEAPPSKIRADFINCSAVLMFIPADEQLQFLKKLKAMLTDTGRLYFRYRDQGLKDGMHFVDETKFVQLCTMAGLDVRKVADFPDPPPSSRPFMWHDYLLTPGIVP